MSIAVFNITKAVENGVTIEPVRKHDGDDKVGLLRIYFGYARWTYGNFKCNIKPREGNFVD